MTVICQLCFQAVIPSGAHQTGCCFVPKVGQEVPGLYFSIFIEEIKKFDTDGFWFDTWSGNCRNTKQKWLPHWSYIQWNLDELCRGVEVSRYTLRQNQYYQVPWPESNMSSDYDRERKKYKIGLIITPTQNLYPKAACCVSAQRQQMVRTLLTRITCLEIKPDCLIRCQSMWSKETGCGIYRPELNCTLIKQGY